MHLFKISNLLSNEGLTLQIEKGKWPQVLKRYRVFPETGQEFAGGIEYIQSSDALQSYGALSDDSSHKNFLPFALRAEEIIQGYCNDNYLRIRINGNSFAVHSHDHRLLEVAYGKSDGYEVDIGFGMDINIKAGFTIIARGA